MIKKIKTFIKKYKEKVMVSAAILAYSYLTRPIPVYAAASYTAPLDNLKVIMVTLAGSIGGVILCYGIYRFAISFQKLDQNGEFDALKTMATGGIFLAASVILAILGA